MKKSLFLLLFIFLNHSLSSQEKKDEVTAYFNQFLTVESQFKLIEKSLPTLEECEQVFIEENAKIYFDAIQEVKQVISKILSEKDMTTFVKVTYQQFSSNDAKSKDGRNSFGMSRIKDVLKSNITFYLVTYKDANGSDSKQSPFKFFVKLNGKWLFFPKPTKVFKN